MHTSGQAWWRLFKIALTIAIIVAVGFQLVRLFSAAPIWQSNIRIRWQWAVTAGVLYLLGLGCSGVFWYRILSFLGQRPSGLHIARAYYVGQLGRYVPGKVIGIVFRAQLMSASKATLVVGMLTIVYEAVTTQTTGGILGGVLLYFYGAGDTGARWPVVALLVLLSIGMLLWGLPRLIQRVMSRYSKDLSTKPPRLTFSLLVQGLATTCLGWGLLGASLWAVMQSLLPEAQPWSTEIWARYTGSVALAMVAGFLVVTVPSGLGVREVVLQQLLTASLLPVLTEQLALETSLLAVLVLRTVWTISDVLAAGIFYLVPTSPLARDVNHCPVTRSSQLCQAALSK